MTSHEEILSLEIKCDKAATVGEYLKELLSALWLECECFSGKRPFGDGAWQYPVYIALIKGEYVDGRLDEDGYVEFLDTKEADDLIVGAIKYIFYSF